MKSGEKVCKELMESLGEKFNYFMMSVEERFKQIVKIIK
jgi:hypothetical protein